MGDIFAGLNTTPASAVKIDPATMSTVASWVGAAGEDECDGLYHDGAFLYAGLDTFRAAVVKINPATMSTVAAWVGAAGEEKCLELVGFISLRIDHLPLMGVH